MAELNPSGSRNRLESPHARRHGSKKPIRIDLTPMVDLGFLLISFFVFTTSLQKTSVMKILLPKPVEDPIQLTPVPKSGVLTLVIGSGSDLGYYEGEDPGQMKMTHSGEIRDILLKKKASTDAQAFYVILKPTAETRFQLLVSLLDEMTIDRISRYVLWDEVSQAESDRLRQLEN